MRDNMIKEGSAEDFAAYIAENKPYLIEIEEEIRATAESNLQATVKVDIHIRGGNVVQLDFWNRRSWKLQRKI